MIFIRSFKSIHAALITAAANWGMYRTVDEEDVIDLMIDIRRLCRVTGLDYARCHSLAREHFRHETGSAR